jgi:hypothetical protein
VPVQDTYEIGTQIECHADANPAANFFWQNMATNERWEDYRLYTYDNMIGSQQVWCHAQNIIGHNVYSADLFFNLTVNRKDCRLMLPHKLSLNVAKALDSRLK